MSYSLIECTERNILLTGNMQLILATLDTRTRLYVRFLSCCLVAEEDVFFVDYSKKSTIEEKLQQIHVFI